MPVASTTFTDADELPSEIRSRWDEAGQPTLHSDVDEATVARARKRARDLEGRGIQRVTLLGFVLAQLDGVDFESAAILLDVKPRRLEKFMHGEEQIPSSLEPRWLLLSEALRNLQAVIRREATARWFTTSIPDLGGMTPLEAVRRGRVRDVLELTRSYREPSFL